MTLMIIIKLVYHQIWKRPNQKLFAQPEPYILNIFAASDFRLIGLYKGLL